MSLVRNYRYQIVNGKTELFITPEPQFIQGIEGEVDLQHEYIDILNTPFDELTADEKLKFEQYQDIQRNFKLSRARAKVTLDTTDITNIGALGRSQDIEQVEKENNINYPRELVFIEGAANTPGTIELPSDDYDTVYIINDDNTIEFIDPYNEVDNSTRPYYIKENGQTIIYVNHFSGGSGTQVDPYLIETLQELQDIRSVAPNGSYVALANDIDASDTVNWNGGAGFIPLSSYNDGHWGVNFDGQGHKISNLYMNSSGNYRVGLMGFVDTDITIKNVFLENVDINSTSSNVGAFIGYVDRFNTINFEKCAVTGSVTYSGGSSGSNIGNGGFVGYQQFSAIKAYNSFFRGTIDDSNYLNDTRVFGSESRSTHVVEHSYFAGTMPGKTQADPLSAGGTYLKSYYNNEVQTYTSNYAEIIGMTTAQMRSQSNYVGWDFTNTWTIDPTVNDGYPIQQIFATGTGGGTETASGASESIILIASGGSAKKSASGQSEQTMEIQSEASGQIVSITASGQSEAQILVSADASGQKEARGPPTDAVIEVGAEASGQKEASSQSEANIEVNSEGLGTVSALFSSGQSEASVEVQAEGQNSASRAGQNESSVEINTEGSGQAIQPISGQSEATVEVTAEGSGQIPVGEMGGTGTELDPYIIQSPQHLQDITNEQVYYKLGNNIDLSGVNWTPIDDFNGNLDGDYKTISNLTINEPTLDNQGLFRHIEGTIENLTIDNFNITGNDYVGALFARSGYTNTGEINNVHIKNSTVTGVNYVGSVAGNFYTVSGKGIAVTDCLVISSNTNFSPSVGLFAGLYEWNGPIEDLVIRGQIDCPASAIPSFGGSGNYSEVHRLSIVAENINTSGTLGNSVCGQGIDAVFDSFYNSDVMGDLGTTVTPATTAEMKTQSTYTNWDFENVWTLDAQINEGYPLQTVFASEPVGTNEGQSEANIEIATETKTLKKVSGASELNLVVVAEGNGRENVPMTGASEATVEINTEGSGQIPTAGMSGSGTELDPYIIKNIYHLQQMNDDKTAWYKLGADIDATDTINWNSGDGFAPIGTSSSPFIGQFDGDGYKITGLYINSTTHTGLFAFVEQPFTGPKNLLIEDWDITGSGYVGALVGQSVGNHFSEFLAYRLGAVNVTITNTDTGTSGWTGGFFGHVTGDDTGTIGIYDNFFIGTINSNDAVGGLIGYSYLRGTGTPNGYDTFHTIDRNYISATFNCPYKYPLAGYDGLQLGSANSTYYNSDLMVPTADNGADPLTTAQMKDSANYPDWDFENIWVIQGSTNDGFPIQQMFTTIIPTASGQSETSTEIAVEGSQIKRGLGATESVVEITAEASGEVKLPETGASEAKVEIAAGGLGQKDARAPPTDSIIEIQADGAGKTSKAGQSESATAIASEGSGKAETPPMTGSGTELDPYIITDVWQLQSMNENRSAYYKLGNDIDATDTVNWNSGAGFIPIGDHTEPFTGGLEGAGHTIDGLYINHSGDTGLFGVVGTPFSGLSEILLTNVDITGSGFVGAFIGNTAENFNDVDDFVIRKIGATGALWNTTEDSGRVGGLFGKVVSNVTLGIYDVFFRGSAGWSTGSSVTGIIGTVYANGDIPQDESYWLKNAYVSATMESNYPWALYSYFYGSFNFDSCYYNSDLLPSYWSDNGADPLTTAQMKDEAFLTGFDFGNEWVIQGSTNGGYPIQQIFTEIIPATSGQSEASVKIATEGSQIKRGLGATESALEITAEASGEAELPGTGFSKAKVKITADGAGKKEAKGVLADPIVEIQAEGSAKTSKAGQGESAVKIDSEGSGRLGGSSANREGSSQANIILKAETSSLKKISSASETALEVQSAADGYKITVKASGNSESLVMMSAESKGHKKSIPQSAETTIQTKAEAFGRKTVISSSNSRLDIKLEILGLKFVKGENQLSLGIATEEIGLKQRNSYAQTAVELKTEESGQKKKNTNSESKIDIKNESLGLKGIKESKESKVKVDSLTDKDGTKRLNSFSEIKVNLQNEADGYKEISKESDAVIEIKAQANGARDTSKRHGGKEASLEIVAEAKGLKSIKDSKDVLINTKTEEEGFKSFDLDLESGVEILSEASGYKKKKEFKLSQIKIDTETSGLKVFTSQKTSELGLILEQSGQKCISKKSEAGLEIVSEGIGEKLIVYKSGSSETTLKTETEAFGFKKISKESDSKIKLITEVNGFKGVNFYSDSAVEIDAQSKFKKYSSGSSSTALNIEASGEGAISFISGAGSSQSQIRIHLEADGSKNNEGKSQAEVLAKGEDEGFKSAASKSESELLLASEQSGQKEAVAKSQSAVELSSEQSGVKLTKAQSESLTELALEQSGRKKAAAKSQSLIDFKLEELGRKLTQNESESIAEIASEQSGQKKAAVESQSSVELFSEQKGVKLTEAQSKTKLKIEAEQFGHKNSEGSVYSSTIISAEIQNLKFSMNKSQTEVKTSIESFGYKKNISYSEVEVLIKAENEGNKRAKNKAKTSVGIKTKGAGFNNNEYRRVYTYQSVIRTGVKKSEYSKLLNKTGLKKKLNNELMVRAAIEKSSQEKLKLNAGSKKFKEQKLYLKLGFFKEIEFLSSINTGLKKDKKDKLKIKAALEKSSQEKLKLNAGSKRFKEQKLYLKPGFFKEIEFLSSINAGLNRNIRDKLKIKTALRKTELNHLYLKLGFKTKSEYKITLVTGDMVSQIFKYPLIIDAGIKRTKVNLFKVNNGIKMTNNFKVISKVKFPVNLKSLTKNKIKLKVGDKTSTKIRIKDDKKIIIRHKK